MLDSGNFKCFGNVVYIVMYPVLENNMTMLAAKMKKGIRACDLEAFLDERMWQQWRGAANVTENIFPVISSQFTYQPV